MKRYLLDVIQPKISMPGNKDKIVIWPVYFDSEKSRSEGRMVSASHAVASPNVDDVIFAAHKAGLKIEIDREKKHPGTWHESVGRILVPRTEKKMAVIRKIARSLRSKGKR